MHVYFCRTSKQELHPTTIFPSERFNITVQFNRNDKISCLQKKSIMNKLSRILEILGHKGIHCSFILKVFGWGKKSMNMFWSLYSFQRLSLQASWVDYYISFWLYHCCVIQMFTLFTRNVFSGESFPLLITINIMLGCSTC